jgi:hypothetical protein
LARVSTHFSDLDDTAAADGDIAVAGGGTVNNFSVSHGRSYGIVPPIAADRRRIAAEANCFLRLPASFADLDHFLWRAYSMTLPVNIKS